MTPAASEDEMRELGQTLMDREILERIADEAGPALDSRRAAEVESWRERLRAGRFHLALLGEFKRGKSTLGNALLGADVLPAAVVPTTSLATFVRYGPSARARIHFAVADAKEIEIGRLRDYATEPGNPRNVLGVRHVEVFVPSPFLAEADLLDTPGIGSAHRHNTEAALAALGEVDAAVVVLAADQPVGEGELAFLESLRPRVSRFLFAVNRMDLLSSEEQAQSLDFVVRTLAAHGFPTDSIFPVSARRALSADGDVGFDRLREALGRFLREEKEAARVEAMRRRLAGILSGRLLELRLADESGRRKMSERNRLRQELARRLEDLASRRAARAAVARDRFRRLLADYDDAFRRFATAAGRDLESAVDQAAAASAGLSNRGFDDGLREFVLSRGQQRLDVFRGETSRRFREELSRVEEDVRRDSDEALRNAYETAARLFGMPSPPAPSSEPAPELAAFDFELRDVRCSLEDAADFVVFHCPRALARRELTRRAKAQARDLLDRSGGRIRHDLLRKGEEYLDKLLSSAEKSESAHAGELLAAVAATAGQPDLSNRGAMIERLSGAVLKLEAA